ncbi:ABC transporter permease [Kitasatospora sp. NBC_01539]|uniref:ABC transporter permease n=1 Tax=Kitasatospora sp. NBC_01539 TaxID=2903577 RepID=UPI0038602747
MSTDVSPPAPSVLARPKAPAVPARSGPTADAVPPTSAASTAAVPAPRAAAQPLASPAARFRRLRRLRAVLLTGLTKSLAIALLLGLWEIAPRLELVDPTFLPPFSEVVVAWTGLLGNGQLVANTQASLTRSLSGFGLSVLIGVPLGLLIGWYKPVANLLSPLLELFRNTAALALLPVFVLILGIGETSKISIVLYACIWPVLLNTISAVRTVDPTLLRLARSLNLSPLRLFQKVILPASVPTVFTGIRLAGAVSILVLVAAEMVGAKAGLGYLINASQYNFAIPEMYAGIVTISLIGVAFNQLLVGLERRFTAWRAPVNG